MATTTMAAATGMPFHFSTASASPRHGCLSSAHDARGELRDRFGAVFHHDPPLPPLLHPGRGPGADVQAARQAVGLARGAQSPDGV